MRVDNELSERGGWVTPIETKRPHPSMSSPLPQSILFPHLAELANQWREMATIRLDGADPRSGMVALHRAAVTCSVVDGPEGRYEVK